MEQNEKIEYLENCRRQLASFNQRLVPFGRNEILNEKDSDAFIKYVQDFLGFAINNMSRPDEVVSTVKRIAYKLRQGLGAPTWRDLHDLDGALNICGYDIRSNGSGVINELFFSERSVEVLLLKKRITRYILLKFHRTVTQLKKRYKNRPSLEVKDEYDVQDLLYSILKSIFDDVEKEKITDTFAGKASRLDIVINDISTIIEVKMTRASLKLSELSGQISEDKDRYQNDGKYKNLIFFIYDPGHYINNHSSLMQHNKSSYKQQNVSVIISPQE